MSQAIHKISRAGRAEVVREPKFARKLRSTMEIVRGIGSYVYLAELISMPDFNASESTDA